VQGALWSPGAREWAARQEGLVLPMYEGALDAVEPLEGRSLLDAGCGAGLALERASKRGALVAGFDAAPGLLEVARERLPNTDLREGDLETIPFDDESFDVVTAFNSVQYAADPIAALRELRRVARRNGRVVVGQWSDPAQCESEALFVALRQVAPPPPGTPAPLQLAGAGQLEARMVEADLHPVAWGDAVCPFEYPSLEDAWLAMRSAGPIARVIDVAGGEKTRKTVLDVFQPSVRDDGTVFQRNAFRWVVATV
jgi:SAM-dependent methyltransferase